MKTTFSKHRWYTDGDGAWVAFQVPGSAVDEINAVCNGDGVYDLDVRRHRRKRSLDANAYYWVLIGQLSEVLRVPPMDIYQQHVQDVGGNYEIVPVREDRIESWKRVWCAGHDGRLALDMGPCRTIPGYHNVKSFIGSSDYDVLQMQRIIDLAVEDCKQNGIETMTEREREAMLDAWAAAYGE